MVGVDPGHDVAAFCRERGLPIFEGTLDEARFTPGSFDAVVVWNTFDQLPDPRPLLQQAVVLLRNGGVLVLRVPNAPVSRGCCGYALFCLGDVADRSM